MSNNNYSRVKLILLTVILMVIGGLTGGAIFSLLSGVWANDAALQLVESNPQLFRFAVFLSHMLTFAIPGAIALFAVFGRDWWSAALLDRISTGGHIGYSALFFVACLPLVALSAWLNLQIDLPDWAVQVEAGTTEMMEALVDFDGPLSLLLTLLGTAVAAGIGEELIFRGILQGRVFDRLPTHLAVWLAAAAFSLIHLELAGFLPRMLLGGILGYTLVWTQSLWVPILLHALFNGLQIVAIYVTGEFTADTEIPELPEWWLVLGGVLVAGWIFWRQLGVEEE